MIQIDIDVKIENIQVQAIPSGMTAVFELKDANNLDTKLFLTFYRKQVDYIMKQFYEVDREKLKEDLRLEFLKRERVMIKELKERLLNSQMEAALLKNELEEIKDAQVEK